MRTKRLSDISSAMQTAGIGKAHRAGPQGAHIILRPPDMGFGIELVIRHADMRALWRRISSVVRQYRGLRLVSLAEGDPEGEKAMRGIEDALRKLQDIIQEARKHAG